MGSCCSNEGQEEQALNRQVTARNQGNRDLDKAMKLLFQRNNTFMRLNLRFSARDLPNMDKGSKTDSFLVIFELVKGKISFKFCNKFLLIRISFEFLGRNTLIINFQTFQISNSVNRRAGGLKFFIVEGAYER